VLANTPIVRKHVGAHHLSRLVGMLRPQ